MTRTLVLIGLSVVVAMSIAQGQSRASTNPNNSEAPAQSPGEHVYGPKDKGVKPPKVISSQDPEYPQHGVFGRVQGTVVLELIIGSDGSPREIKVVRSLSSELDDAAIKAVKKWKFAPATKDGEPVPVKVNLEVSFRHN
jgi:TonB family protein